MNSIPGEAEITITGLKKNFRDLTAVDNISFEVRKGEIFGLLGPNGAGKTTTINMICGLLPATSGTIKYQSHDIREIKSVIGYCPQENIYFPKLTCLEQLVFMGNIYGISSDKSKPAGMVLLDMLGLSNKSKVYARNLSGGMKRRLNIALALIHNPRILTATITFVSEIENKTILRLKLSRITSFEYITGITVVQLLVGIISILLTLLTAAILGFEFHGSAALFLLIAVLTSFSIIAFSLIIAALTKTANEVLVIGNFPLFLFMFFTGAAFPFKSEGFFTLFGYPVSLQGLMSPTHAISALNKIMIMQMKLSDIIPEIISLLILTAIYFFFGLILFQRRHMQMK